MRTSFLEMVNKKETKIGSDFRTNILENIRFFSKLGSINRGIFGFKSNDNQ